MVAPYMGAWIEIIFVDHPKAQPGVAPYMGAWIEIKPLTLVDDVPEVAPYMGAWIEIHNVLHTSAHFPVSLPTWERGLKLSRTGGSNPIKSVAPYMGAWIEIITRIIHHLQFRGRSLHGSVD